MAEIIPFDKAVEHNTKKLQKNPEVFDARNGLADAAIMFDNTDCYPFIQRDKISANYKLAKQKIERLEKKHHIKIDKDPYSFIREHLEVQLSESEKRRAARLNGNEKQQ